MAIRQELLLTDALIHAPGGVLQARTIVRGKPSNRHCYRELHYVLEGRDDASVCVGNLAEGYHTAHVELDIEVLGSLLQAYARAKAELAQLREANELREELEEGFKG